jgi:hypothetical protein
MLTMGARESKVTLTTHITFSVGWIGTVAAFLALSIVGLIGNDQTVRSCYISMEVVALFIIVPFCLLSLVTGLVQALGTHWGLFKHWWILVKLGLTVIATLILLLHMQPISYLADVTTQQILASDELRNLRIRIIADAAAAILVLVAITIVSVYKPWGKVQFGVSLPGFKATTKKPMGKFLVIGFAIAITIFIMLHLMKGGVHH